jgi:hypothetical protein
MIEEEIAAGKITVLPNPKEDSNSDEVEFVEKPINTGTRPINSYNTSIVLICLLTFPLIRLRYFKMVFVRALDYC